MRFFYMASPYSKYHLGRAEAYREACVNTALLLAANITTFSPIVHSHPLEEAGHLPVANWAFWSTIDENMLRSSRGLIVLQLEGWDKSEGVRHEIEWAEMAALPIFYMPPGEVSRELRHFASLHHTINT